MRSEPKKKLQVDVPWGLGDSGVGRPPLKKDDTRNKLLLLQLPRTEKRDNCFLTVSPPHLQNTPA